MESIEELRKMDDDELIALGNGQYGRDYRHNSIADEIEREIAERYMELPVDADGVPIKLGDRIKCTDTPTSRTFIVSAIGKTKGGNPVFHGYEDKGDHLERHRIGPNTRHVKPRTIEDVLLDYGNEIARQGHQAGLTMHEIVAKYADELRGMGVER